MSNGTGEASYNARLARDRAEAVRAHRDALGVPAERIAVQAGSDRQPVVDCERLRHARADYRACLLPNRRVEVVLESAR